MSLILGTASPRRREILNFFSLPFIQIPSEFDENNIPFEGDPKAYALSLSEMKADLLAKKFPMDLILTADTVVYRNPKIYNKPQTEEEAFQFLSELSGNWHSVFTAVTLQKAEVKFSDIEETKILFHPLTPDQIRTYHHHCSFTDKAGGYAIQQCGSIVISSIEGCYYNVMGLPINTLKNLLLNFQIDLWHFLKSF